MVIFQIPCKRFTFPLLFESIQKHRPTLLVMGSHHYVQMSEQDPDPRLQLDSVRVMMPTGASVPRVCTEKLKQKFPKCVIYVNLYGQTESGTVVLGNQEYEGLGGGGEPAGGADVLPQAVGHQAGHLGLLVAGEAGVVEQDHTAVLQVVLPPLHWEVTT